MNRILYENLIQYILTNQERFYRLAYSYTRNQEDALDAVQNAVCKALEAYEHIRNTGAIKTWFYRILVNESMQILKQRKKLPQWKTRRSKCTVKKPITGKIWSGS